MIAYHRIPAAAWSVVDTIDHGKAGSNEALGVLARLYALADAHRWRPLTGRLTTRNSLAGACRTSWRLAEAVLYALVEVGLAEVEEVDGKRSWIRIHPPEELASNEGEICLQKDMPTDMPDEMVFRDSAPETTTNKADNREQPNAAKTHAVPVGVPARIPCAHQTPDRIPQTPEIKPPSPQNEHEHVLTRGRETSPGDLDLESGLRLIEGDLSWTAASTRRLFESVWATSRPQTPYAAARQEQDRAEQLAGLLVKAGWGLEECSARIEDYLAEHAAGRAFPKPKGGIQQRTGLPQFLSVVRRELEPKPSRPAPAEDGRVIDGYWYSAAELRQMEASG